MIWVEIILLIIKFGPMILELVKEIWDLIKKQPEPLQAGYRRELRDACKHMRSNKIAGQNELYSLREKLQMKSK